MKNDRIVAIRQHLFQKGFSTVQQISDAVNASVATIRRDLLALEAENIIIRSHGGARIAESAESELAFATREHQNLSAKRSIAESAFSMITPNSAIFLDAGTTVLQVARQIRLNPMPLSVFTNCLAVAQVLMDVPELKVTLIAGTIRPKNASMVGSFAIEMLDRLWFDLLFLGAGAIAPDCCLYSLNEEEAQVNEKMLSRATKTVLLVDSSKFSDRLTYKVAPLSAEISVITDSGISPDRLKSIKNVGCTIQVISNIDDTVDADQT